MNGNKNFLIITSSIYLPGTVNTLPQFNLHKMLMMYLLQRKMRCRDVKEFVHSKNLIYPYVIFPLSYTQSVANFAVIVGCYSGLCHCSAIPSHPYYLSSYTSSSTSKFFIWRHFLADLGANSAPAAGPKYPCMWDPTFPAKQLSTSD
uniref:Uncharacterized protein n=1 Tax=Pipistrellus kuhlii TaxID=59472 RepID=A0A7J8B1V1_PIPKU|nr:hypothetical protein mPipKuh1_007830 [Pipistrellus kuhlii]